MKYTWSDVEKDVHGLALNIALSGWMPEYIVGLSPTGVIPATMLSELLDVELEVIKMDASVCWLAEDAYEKRTNILVMLDLNNRGDFFNWIVSDWKSSCSPNSKEWENVWHNNVKFAVLVNNERSEWKEIDFCAHYINKDCNKINTHFPWEKSSE